MFTTSDTNRITALVGELVPASWFVDDGLSVSVDDDEVLVVGTLASSSPGDGDVAAFREATRPERVAIARRLQPLLRRTVSWGVNHEGVVELFTSASVPTMTRLRVDERRVLDTLAAAGVARSRSDALAWCVHYVAKREAEWLDELRSSLDTVSSARAKGPTLD